MEDAKAMKPIKRFQTAVKWLDKGLQLSFPGTTIGYAKDKKKYYIWQGFNKSYRKTRPDSMIKALLKKHGEVHTM